MADHLDRDQHLDAHEAYRERRARLIDALGIDEVRRQVASRVSRYRYRKLLGDRRREQG